MTASAIVFFASLSTMVLLLVSKWKGMATGRESFMSRFLARFDARLGVFLMGFSIKVRQAFFMSWNFCSNMLHQARVSIATHLHQLLQFAEKKVRLWREVARERKLDRKDSSLFIKDVADYKAQLRQQSQKF